MILLLLYLLIAIGASFLCSLLEAVLLSLPQSYVALLVEEGKPSGVRLQRMKNDIDRPLAAILTLNTFAHTLGAAGVGAQAANLWGEAWMGLISFVLTLLILVFSEIIPKTVGAMHARALAPWASRVIWLITLLLLPLVVACNWVSSLLSRDVRTAKISREEIRSLAGYAHEEGAIDADEFRVIRNLIALRETTVDKIMTPRSVVFSLDSDLTVGEATRGEPPRFARIPIVSGSLDQPRGMIHRHQLFKALSENQADTKLSQLVRPLHAVKEDATLPHVLNDFLGRREQLFLVVDQNDKTIGIVTLEDVMETLLGVEIMDETDTVKSMRKLAERLVTLHQQHTHN